MVIGVDCDGVLTDLSLYIREYGRQWFGREPDNDAGYSVREVFNCTEKEEFRFGLKYFFWYCRKWPPREDAQKVLSRLTDKGHTLYGISARKFITMKTPLGIYSKSLFKKWMKKNGFIFSEVCCCSEDNAPEEKLFYCRKYSVDIMIDDQPDVSLYLSQNGIKTFLFDAPYNRGISHDNMVRVYSWSEIDSLIRNYETMAEWRIR